MSIKPRVEWIYAHDGRGGRPFGVGCERCGFFEKIATPMPVDDYLKVLREFTDKHKSCPEVPA